MSMSLRVRGFQSGERAPQENEESFVNMISACGYRRLMVAAPPLASQGGCELSQVAHTQYGKVGFRLGTREGRGGVLDVARGPAGTSAS